MEKNGCSLIVHYTIGTMFLDVSSSIKTRENIFELLNGMVEKIGKK